MSDTTQLSAQTGNVSAGSRHSFLIGTGNSFFILAEDSANNPISNCFVEILNNGKEISSGVTDSSGKFSFNANLDWSELEIGFPKVLTKLKLSNMWNNHHGRLTVPEVGRLIGGKVELSNFENMCAVRMSRAFNYTGMEIKYIPPTRLPSGKIQHNCVSGKDKKWYIFRVITFEREILVPEFGAPDIVSTDRSRFMGKPGIILFGVSGWENATGHLDLWDGQDPSGAEYFDKAKQIKLWGIRDVKGPKVDQSPIRTVLKYIIS